MTSHADKRDAQMARVQKGAPPLAQVFSAPVVGVTFQPTYPQVFFEIEALMNPPAVMIDEDFIPPRPETQWIDLIREPGNKYDENAIGVWWRNVQLGHIARPLAFRLAKELDAEVDWLARVEAVLISPENPDQPGIIIRLKRNDPTPEGA